MRAWKEIAEEAVLIVGHLAHTAARMLTGKNMVLERSLKKVQGIAKQSIDRLPAIWNEGYMAGKKDALKSREEGSGPSSATDWHGGNEIIQEHWQELVWQAYWFLSAQPNEDLFWKVAVSGSSGLAVQVVERLSR